MKFIFIFFTSVLIIISCKNNPTENKTSQAELNEKLTNMNKILVENESKRIDEFIQSHSFHTEETGTGLRYEIYKHGVGDHPGLKSIVEIKYRVFLLDGTMCYSTDSTGPLKIQMGIGEQVRGLEEGIMLMMPGDKARMIVPAHLGYGMAGDQQKIPPASTLFYDVELLNIIK